jgi:hypothetical protein
VELASQVLGYFNLAVPVQKLRAAKLTGIFWLLTEKIFRLDEFIFYYISFDFLFFRLVRAYHLMGWVENGQQHRCNDKMENGFERFCVCVQNDRRTTTIKALLVSGLPCGRSPHTQMTTTAAAKWKTENGIFRNSDPLTVFPFGEPPSPARGEGKTRQKLY